MIMNLCRFWAKRWNPSFSLFKQCIPVINDSKIPSECSHKSNESLPSITFEINDIETFFKNLDPKKPNGHDMLSILFTKNLWTLFSNLF